jgi:hypothetical protein
MATPLNKLRILFCGVEFPGAVHHTQQFLKHYPHISVSQSLTKSVCGVRFLFLVVVAFMQLYVIRETRCFGERKE